LIAARVVRPAVEGHVEHAAAVAHAEIPGEAFGDPGATGMDADDGRLVRAGQAGLHLVQQRGIQRLGIQQGWVRKGHG
jgi:hypothetical protein